MPKWFSMDDYVDVAARIVEFRDKYPEGSLQQVSVDFRDFAGASWVVFTAAAYRTPDDPRPGHGTAWEPVPGKTSYTRDSELQNAETAAWGRAIVAVLAANTKRGIASAQEVKGRQPNPLLEALTNPTDEPDPDSHSYERAAEERVSGADDHVAALFAMRRRLNAALAQAHPGKSDAELGAIAVAACKSHNPQLDPATVADLMKLAQELEEQP